MRKTTNKLRGLSKDLKHHFSFVHAPKPSMVRPTMAQFQDVLYHCANKRAFFESAEFREFIDRKHAVKWVGDPASQTAASDAFSVHVASYEQRPHRSGQYLLYMLRVEKDGKIWMVGKRYTDFVQLNRTLLKSFNQISLMKLPPKLAGTNSEGRSRFTAGRSAMNVAFLDERMAALQKFIADCLLQDSCSAASTLWTSSTPSRPWSSW